MGGASPSSNLRNMKNFHCFTGGAVLLMEVSLAAASMAIRSDEQKVGVWKGHKFEWHGVDAALTNPVSIQVTLPAEHRFFTVVIDGTNGGRVRNLLDMAKVTGFGGKTNATAPQLLTLEWNGLDDRGEPLPEGEYRVRGVSHPGVTLAYDYSLLGAGTPPWEFYPNSAWGGDHEFPNAIACLPGATNNVKSNAWRVALGGRTAEGGSPGFVLGADDRKVFSFGNGWTGPNALAARDGVLWAGLGRELVRMKFHSGEKISFQTTTGAVKSLKFEPKEARIHALAVGEKYATLVLRQKDREKNPKVKPDRLLLLDKASGKILQELSPPADTVHNGVAFDARDRVLLATASGLLRMDMSVADAAFVAVTLDGCEKPSALATDRAGNLFIHDAGADNQVKVFSPDGKFLHAIGTRGGQQSAEFDANALHQVEAISVADDGALWVVEGNTLEPRYAGFARRVAVWDASGKFSRHFIGGTWYGANLVALHAQDPSLAYAYGMIYRVEPGVKPAYAPLRYASSTREPKSPFALWTGSPGVLFGSTKMFRSAASGVMREYLLQANGYPILYQADARGDYRPVFAAGSHEHNKAFPKADDDKKAVFLWSDLNGDEQVQPEEFTRVRGGSHSVAFFSGWGYPPPLDLVWRFGGWEFAPTRFTERGVPVYDASSAKKLAAPEHFLRVGEHLIATVPGKWDSPEAGYYFAGNYLFTDLDGRRAAHYRINWPAVHASWSSTLYAPGQTGRTIGENFFSGIADSGGEIGHVIAAHGNKGQAFILSEDGLFVTTLFRDTREAPQGQGATESRGADWTKVTMNEEAFGGWFGRQDDGKLRYLFGHTAAHVVQVNGLEKVKRFDAGHVRLAARSSRGEEAQTSPRKDQSLVTSAATRMIPNVRGAFPGFKADGDASEWKEISRQEIKLGDTVVARVALAHDLDNLWLLAEVEDFSPAMNAAREPNFLFKSGDAIDLQLGPLRPARTAPGDGDIRILIAPGAKKPIATRYRPVKKDAKPDEAFTFESPVRAVKFASVTPLKEFEAVFTRTATGYICEAKLKSDAIALKHAASGLRLRADVGVLFSNEGGEGTLARAYLFDHSPGAGITADVPSEAELRPAEWGEWGLE